MPLLYASSLGTTGEILSLLVRKLFFDSSSSYAGYGGGTASYQLQEKAAIAMSPPQWIKRESLRSRSKPTLNRANSSSGSLMGVTSAHLRRSSRSGSRPDLQNRPTQLKVEFAWLYDTVGRIEDEVANALVCHRGFHSQDPNSNRPVENSLPAYEIIWSAGIGIFGTTTLSP